jgi:hypothetical protein
MVKVEKMVKEEEEEEEKKDIKIAYLEILL